MNKSAKQVDWDLQTHYDKKVKPQTKKYPWILRITEHKDKPSPVFIVKERVFPETNGNREGAIQSHLEERGMLYGGALRRVLPIIRDIIGKVRDDLGIPFELAKFVKNNPIEFRGNLPLDDTAGYKLAVIFILQSLIQELDRVEIIARRVNRFTREEAAYWYSRMTNFGEDANRWAIIGMRIMLGGQPSDPAVEKMLEQLRGSL